MPVITQILIGISNFFSHWWYILLGIIVVLMWVSGPACSHLIAGMIAGDRPEKKEAKQKK